MSKRFNILCFGLLTLSGPALMANIIADGLKKAGQGAESGAKATGKLAGKGAVAAGKGVGKGAKKGVHGLARGTEKGAGKVGDKTQ